jgi:DNA-nicking Smr family endonuclease
MMRINAEDRQLWEKVLATVSPLKARRPSIPPLYREEFRLELSPPPTPQKSVHLSKLDQPTHKKITKGKVELEKRIDLHGLTQEEAYAYLINFLTHAYHHNIRYCLIITGKGSASGGVLKQNVPRWLATPTFRLYVSAYDEASRQHGGAGAIYVRLRQKSRSL